MPDPIIRPTPGFDYLLTDGRKVRFIEYVCHAEGRGWACWPHGERGGARIGVTDIKQFAQELTA